MARGSDTSRGDYPRDCHGCGKHIRLRDDTAWYEHDHDTGVKRSWHMECRIQARVARAVAWRKSA